MARLRPPDLTGEVVDGHELLGPGLEIADLDPAVAELLADDDREVGPIAGGVRGAWLYRYIGSAKD